MSEAVPATNGGDNDPEPNDEPKAGFSRLSEELPSAVTLSYTLDDGRTLIVNLGLSLEARPMAVS